MKTSKRRSILGIFKKRASQSSSAENEPRKPLNVDPNKNGKSAKTDTTIAGSQQPEEKEREIRSSATTTADEVTSEALPRRNSLSSPTEGQRLISPSSTTNSLSASRQSRRSSAASIISDQGQEILKQYRVERLVGKGGFAKVYLVKRKADGQVFAMKVMRKEHVRKMKQVTNVINEKNIQKTAAGTFIVKIFSSFQDPCFKENDARFYAGELFLALAYLHSLGIVYRDLKPENILISSHGHIKIADLGFAKMIKDGTTKSFCGTPSYLAPEVLERKPYGMAVDWWSYGVLVFQLCSGCSPFQESHPSKTFTRILNCAIRWPPEPQKYFSNVVFDLIMGLFELDPIQRLTEEEIRDHEWFEDLDFEALNNRLIPPPKSVLPNLNPLIKQVSNMDNSSSCESLGLSEGDVGASTQELFLGF